MQSASYTHTMTSWNRYVASYLCLLSLVHGLSSSDFRSSPSQTSVVTGANGYVGRAVVHSLLEQAGCQDIVCLVRAQRVSGEQEYWKAHQSPKTPSIRVLPYDMLDAGKSLREALKLTSDGPRCVYHVASVFGPTEDHKQTALDNVQGTEDLVRTLAEIDNCKLVLTSSMAAVRGSGQEPSNGKYYTEADWNTQSELGANWGASYQWSKAESERRAWALCKEHNIPMVCLCPAFVFGPPVSYGADAPGGSVSYSLTLVNQWIHGESQVQSRLFVDLRDVAQAHVEAGTRADANGKRFIVSTEARVPSQEIASWLKEVCTKSSSADPDKIHFDADYQGGFIPIGQREVEAAERLHNELGVALRPVKETMMDMTEVLLRG